jgi:hypothetical protein
MKKSLLIALSAASVLLPQNVLAADWMSGREIMKELVGQELSFRGKISGKIIYRRSGEMRMLSTKGRAVYGEWRIDEENGSLCSRLKQRRKAKEICYRTRHDGFGYRTDQGYKLMPLGF